MEGNDVFARYVCELLRGQRLTQLPEGNYLFTFPCSAFPMRRRRPPSVPVWAWRFVTSSGKGPETSGTSMRSAGAVVDIVLLVVMAIVVVLVVVVVVVVVVVTGGKVGREIRVIWEVCYVRAHYVRVFFGFAIPHRKFSQPPRKLPPPAACTPAQIQPYSIIGFLLRKPAPLSIRKSAILGC